MNEPNPKRLRKTSASYKRAIIFGLGSGLLPARWCAAAVVSVRSHSLGRANAGDALFSRVVWKASHANAVASVLGVLAIMLFIHMVRAVYRHGCRRAVLAERERLQLDLHDTLAQSYAGIGFQLQAIRREIPAELRHLERQLDLARGLLLHSRKEALRTFFPPSGETNEHFNLLRSLEMSAHSMAGEGALVITASIAGEQRLLRPAIATALLRIGREAIANAIRHAEPTQLAIALIYDQSRVALSVTDNGTGFVDRGDLLGFGLRGMRKQAATVSATFDLSSSPGEGTQVSVVFLNQSASYFRRFRNTLRHYVLEPLIHAHAEE